MAKTFISLQDAQRVCSEIHKKIKLGGVNVRIQYGGGIPDEQIHIDPVQVPLFDVAQFYGTRQRIKVDEVLKAVQAFYENWKI